MKQEKIQELKSAFESIAQEFEQVEFWLARDLQKLLDYSEWEVFEHTLKKAEEACKNVEENVSDHFVVVDKVIKLNPEEELKIKDFMLTRFACYLIVQNGDPKIEKVAFGQAYFALQTRKQELLEERLELDERKRARIKLAKTETLFSKNIFERGVDQFGFGRIRNKGDQALFGGSGTKEMKLKLGVPKSRPLADFLPTITIKAKDFATEITNFNVENHNLYGEKEITKEHVKNNKDVRNLLKNRGIIPEDLPAAEDFKKLERRVKAADKKLLKQEKSKKQNKK